MSEIKSASMCLFVGCSLNGQVKSVVGEEVKVPFVAGGDVYSGMAKVEYEQYLSVRFVPGKGKQPVKVMRINQLSDAALMSELQNWTFTADEAPVRKASEC